MAQELLPILFKAFSTVYEEQQHQSQQNQSSSSHAFQTSSANGAQWTLWNTKHPDNRPSAINTITPSVTPIPPHQRPPPPARPIYHKSGKRMNTDFFCDHCVIYGHNTEKCYKLHGHPKHLKDNNGSRRVNNTWHRDLLDNGQRSSSSNTEAEPVRTPVATTHHVAHYKSTPYDPNKAKLQKSGTTVSSCYFSHFNKWIIDSSASEHMSRDDVQEARRKADLLDNH